MARARNAGLAISLYGWFCPNCAGQADAYRTARNVILDLKAKGIVPGVNYTYFYIDFEDCDPGKISSPQVKNPFLGWSKLTLCHR